MPDILLINNALHVSCSCNYEKHILSFYFYDVNTACEMRSVYTWIGFFAYLFELNFKTDWFFQNASSKLLSTFNAGILMGEGGGDFSEFQTSKKQFKNINPRQSNPYPSTLKILIHFFWGGGGGCNL